jgi:hypothetical protein
LGQCNKELLELKETLWGAEQALEHERSLNQHIFVEEYTGQLCMRAMMQSKQLVEPGYPFHNDVSQSERHSQTQYETLVDTKCEKIRAAFLEDKCTGFSIEVKKHEQTIEDLKQRIKVLDKKLEVQDELIALLQRQLSESSYANLKQQYGLQNDQRQKYYLEKSKIASTALLNKFKIMMAEARSDSLVQQLDSTFQMMMALSLTVSSCIQIQNEGVVRLDKVCSHKLASLAEKVARLDSVIKHVSVNSRSVH